MDSKLHGAAGFLEATANVSAPEAWNMQASRHAEKHPPPPKGRGGPGLPGRPPRQSESRQQAARQDANNSVR